MMKKQTKVNFEIIKTLINSFVSMKVATLQFINRNNFEQINEEFNLNFYNNIREKVKDD